MAFRSSSSWKYLLGGAYVSVGAVVGYQDGKGVYDMMNGLQYKMHARVPKVQVDFSVKGELTQSSQSIEILDSVLDNMIVWPLTLASKMMKNEESEQKVRVFMEQAQLRRIEREKQEKENQTTTNKPSAPVYKFTPPSVN